MKIKLTEQESRLLSRFDIFIDKNKNYSDDELLDISEKIYEQESFNYNNPVANKLALLADKIQDLI